MVTPFQMMDNRNNRAIHVVDEGVTENADISDQLAAAFENAGPHDWIILPNGTYKISSRLVIPETNIAPNACTLTLTNDDELVGIDLSQQRIQDMTLYLPKIQRSARRWSETNVNGGDTGILIGPSSQNTIYAPLIKNFGVGLLLHDPGGAGRGISMNEWHLGTLRDNAVHIRFSTENNGYVTEQVFDRGKLEWSSSFPSVIPGTRCLECLEEAGSGSVFRKMNFENRVAEYMAHLNGHDATLEDCRWEWNQDPQGAHPQGIIRFGPDSWSNNIIRGAALQFMAVECDAAAKDNFVETAARVTTKYPAVA